MSITEAADSHLYVNVGWVLCQVDDYWYAWRAPLAVKDFVLVVSKSFGSRQGWDKRWGLAPDTKKAYLRADTEGDLRIKMKLLEQS